MNPKSLILSVFLAGAAGAAAAAGPALLDLEYRPLAGREKVNLAERHHGQVLLVVNTASKCGYTPQYEGLEALREPPDGVTLRHGYPRSRRPSG